jgi:hypothetical protein
VRLAAERGVRSRQGAAPPKRQALSPASVLETVGAILKSRVGRILSAERAVPTHTGADSTNLLSA